MIFLLKDNHDFWTKKQFFKSIDCKKNKIVYNNDSIRDILIVENRVIV